MRLRSEKAPPLRNCIGVSAFVVNLRTSFSNVASF
jgi:hypothetical protein